MIAILKDFEAIKKDSKNQQQGFMFRGIDAFMNESHLLFAKHEVFVTQKTLNLSQDERQTKAGGLTYASKVEVEYTFWASDGSSVSSSIAGEANDTGDKGISKCYAIALKYCLMQTFLVPTEEMKDPDADTNPETTGKGKPVAAKSIPATPEQLGEIKKILDTNPPLDTTGLVKIQKAITAGMTADEAAKTLKWMKDGILKIANEIK